jgi:trans-aconitate 2-methyltransferase
MPHHEDEASQDCWDGELYAANAAHHRRADDAFLATLPLRPTDRVLDLGCGTGEFTNKLAALVPEGLVVGLDASQSQIAVALPRKAHNVELVVGRADELDPLLAGFDFDVVVSRAVLHWIPEPLHPKVLAAIRARLRPGGLLRVEFGGSGQIDAVRLLLDEESKRMNGPTSPWFFPTVATYTALLEGAGFDTKSGFVRLLQQRRAIPTFEALAGYLRSQVFLAYEASMSSETRRLFRARSEERASAELRRADGSYDLDFVRMDALSFRP